MKRLKHLLAAWVLRLSDALNKLAKALLQDELRANAPSSQPVPPGATGHRTIADKRAAVGALLGDPVWSRLSDREIARRCVVSAPFVGKMRKERQSANGVAA
jgi:hypothetical protein